MKYRPLLKIILTVLLIFVAGFTALLIKDTIDSHNPEYSLPVVTVSADGTPVPVVTAGFEWNYLFNGKIEKTAPDVYEMSVTPATLIGGEVINIDYSVKPVSVTMRRTDSYSYNFFETDSFNVPTSRGGYLYELNIRYSRGSESCYFYLIVD